MIETGLFPGAARQMMTVGEETGTLDEQLASAALYFEGELEVRVRRFTNMFEPATIIFVGVCVGFVAVALVSGDVRHVGRLQDNDADRSLPPVERRRALVHRDPRRGRDPRHRDDRRDAGAVGERPRFRHCKTASPGARRWLVSAGDYAATHGLPRISCSPPTDTIVSGYQDAVRTAAAADQPAGLGRSRS